MGGIEIDNPDRPEANNLCRLYALTRGLSAEGAAEECKDMNWGTFKATLTESLVEYLSPIQGEYARLMEDRAFLKDILLDGRQQALAVAQDTLDPSRRPWAYARRASRAVSAILFVVSTCASPRITLYSTTLVQHIAGAERIVTYNMRL